MASTEAKYFVHQSMDSSSSSIRLSSVAPPEVVADVYSFPCFILVGPGLDVIFSPALLDSPWLLGIAYVPYRINHQLNNTYIKSVEKKKYNYSMYLCKLSYAAAP